MIIDFHTHCFPDRIAQRAIEQLKAESPGLENHTDGTLSDTFSKMEEWGVSKFVVQNIATNPRQQTNVNNFAIENDGGRCVMFGSVHPKAENALEELERIKEGGLKGVKLHCEYQEFFVDDPAMFPIYDAIRELGLILMFHGGTDIAFEGGLVRCAPARVAKVAGSFPGIKMVVAHLGGYREYGQTIEHLIGKPIYFDTSTAECFFDRGQAERLIKLHGEEYLLFGSDCPWADAGEAARFIDSLDIPSSRKDAILYKNALYLLGENP
ncbi:MAG: amidohydrolase family protein [Clostridiales bacterium]|jgi:predicted TIM-barrel fold metal-dependent hydrolase|nr:amidohydrolase family protein [Clostridiales bacterium]